MNWDEFRAYIAEAKTKEGHGIVLTVEDAEWILESLEKVKGINKALKEHYLGMENDNDRNKDASVLGRETKNSPTMGTLTGEV